MNLYTVTWLLVALAGPALQQDVVKTRQGDVRGILMTSRGGRNFHAFLGIPYAAPPVGELRFKAPEPPGQWAGVLNATVDGPMCIQKNYLEPNPQVVGQEDCLVINVFTPHLRPDHPLDVMVYIHGGGFFAGSGATYLQGPQYFMDKDILLVTFNYRLGVMGFLSTEDSASPGNYGFKDQVAALRWVQGNIAGFGGNPGSVTIFGQSAGAASTHLQMLSPLSAGLFHRVISQSGSALAAFAKPIDSRAIARRQAMYVGCDPEKSSADLVQCLRATDAKTLVDSGDRFKFWSVDPLDVFGPAVEHGPDAFLPANPSFLLKTGQYHRLPWMTGVVTDEGILRVAPILSNKTLLEDLNRRMTTLAPRLLELSKSVEGADQQVDYVMDRILQFFLHGERQITPENEQGFLHLYTDRSFVHAFHKSATLHQRTSPHNVFLYHFAYRGAYSFTPVFANTTRNFGVSHCDDLIYLFSTPLLFPPWPENHPDLQMSKRMIELWTNFAKFGHPTPEGSSGQTWTPVVPGDHLDYVEISAGPNLTMKQDLFKDRMQFWDSLPLSENDFRETSPHHLIDLMYSYIVYLLD